jgi:hypothetical protein
MAGENRIPHGEYEPLKQPEHIDKALQSCLDISEQIEPLGISNKQEIKSALIALNFMLSDAYDEVLERNGSPPDELAEETYQEALSTLEHYIHRHKKEPEPNVDADLTSGTDFSN